MRRRGRAALLMGVVALVAAGVPVAVAGPASATLIDSWTFDQRPADLPATDDPARALESASGTVSYGPDGEVDVQVTLGGVPDEQDTATLHLALGTPDGTGGCVPGWETSVPTWDPADGSTGGSADVDVTGTFALGVTWTCGEVWLSSADGAETYDRLAGGVSGHLIADPGARLRLGSVSGTRVRPHRWQTLHLRVRSFGSPIDGVRVRGRGHDVRVRRSHIATPLEDRESTRIAVRVRLDASHRRRVQLEVTPYGYLAFPHPTTKLVWLRPVRR